MKLLFATILLFAPKAFASSENEGSLRGAIVEPVDLDRELLSLGATSTSLSFSVASAKSASDSSCFDAYDRCRELGLALVATSAHADVEGNAFSVAYSEHCLWLDVTCRAYAQAHSRSCAFTKVDGDIKVDTKQDNGFKDVVMKLYLRAATQTIALAETEAIAKSYADVGAQSFTTISAYCASVKNKSIFCGGAAATELTVVGTAQSGSYGAASSLATSGSVTSSMVQVSGKGASLEYLNGMIGAYAGSWSFANSASIVDAFARVFAAEAAASFVEFCAEEHGRICADAANSGRGICSVDATEACAEAEACGGAFGAGLSQGCAASYAAAQAGAEVKVFVSANVSCKNTPQFTWQCAGAYADTVCRA